MALDPVESAIVKNTALFAVLDDPTCAALLDQAFVSDYAESELLFNKGDAADRFFVVLAGRVHLFALTENGDQTIIEVIAKGESFAEAAIFARGDYPLNAEVISGTRLLNIPAKPFLRRVASQKGLAAQMLGSLARWERRLINEIADLKNRSPVQRLGLFLIALAPPGQTNRLELHLPLAKGNLASRIGVTPESFSRALKRLEKSGVSCRGQRFIIEDVEALRQFCGAD
ncbi:MAG TPA: cyclic nucleotide-binding domain-containing protein [Rhodospirillaceae bacterium]|nr:cyclic nucleotide-binding domain-containing protein [Rhodospirillaceae bacterium]